MDALEFQKAQKAKLLACYGETPESVLAKAQVDEDDDLEKGGEGSKGGKIIGHTRSGKPVYATRSTEKAKDFTSEDHKDAAAIHHITMMGTTGPSGDEKHRLARSEHAKAAGIKSGEYISEEVTDHAKNFKYTGERWFSPLKHKEKHSHGIVDEDGNSVETEHLHEALKHAKDENDFVKKVNYGITNEKHTVGEENDNKIRNWHKENKK